jgi:hypothetical protein
MCLLNLDLFVCVIILVSMFSLCLYGVCDYHYGGKLTQGAAKVIVPPDIKRNEKWNHSVPLDSRTKQKTRTVPFRLPNKKWNHSISRIWNGTVLSYQVLRPNRPLMES